MIAYEEASIPDKPALFSVGMDNRSARAQKSGVAMSTSLKKHRSNLDTGSTKQATLHAPPPDGLRLFSLLGWPYSLRALKRRQQARVLPEKNPIYYLASPPRSPFRQPDLDRLVRRPRNGYRGRVHQ